MADDGQSSSDSGFRYYHYTPSIAAAAIFIVLFVISTVLHTYQMIRTRTWYMTPLVIGGLFSWIGYVGRVVSSTQSPDWTLGPYLVQTLMLLLAPALFAASIYMELGRIIRLTNGEHLSLIRVNWVTKIFVTGDVLSFLAQSAGGGLMSQPENMDLGSNIVVAGLFIQLAFFGFFVIVAGLFHFKIRRTPTTHTMMGTSPWERHLYVLYIVSVLIFVRCVFRAIEYIQGFNGYLLTKEVFLYIFDAVLMFGVVAILNIVHPSEINAWLRGGVYSKNAYQFLEMKSESESHQLE